MNYKRMAVAGAAVFLSAMAYEFAVYGVLLKGLQQPHYGTLLRPETEVSQGGMFFWALVGSAVAAFFYAHYVKGSESGVAQGALFGACLGVIAAVVPQAYNALLFQGWPFFPQWALSGFGEHLLVGLVLGLTYRK